MTLSNCAATWSHWVTRVGVQATIVALVVLVALHLLRRADPRLRYALMAIAWLKFVLPPSFTAGTSVFVAAEEGGSGLERILGVDRDAKPVGTNASAMRRFSSLAMWEDEVAGFDSHQENAAGAVASVDARRTSDDDSRESETTSWWMMFHVLGALGVVLASVKDRVRLERIARSGTRLGFDGNTRILECANVRGPLAYGFSPRTILLPMGLKDSLDRRGLDIVLAHESTHLRHRDYAANLLALAITAIWWFHPLAWWLLRETRRIQEDWCDDEVIARRSVSASSYCSVLLEVARIAQRSSDRWSNLSLAAASPMHGGRHGLVRRFARVLSEHRSGVIRTVFQACLVLIVGLALLPFARSEARQSVELQSGTKAPGLTLLIDASSQAYLHGKSVTIDEVSGAAKDSMTKDGTAVVDLHVQEAAPYRAVQTILECLREAGASHVTFAGWISDKEDEIRRRVRSGREYLQRQQRADGSFGDIEESAIATLALMGSGEPSLDVEKSIAFLTRHAASSDNADHGVATALVVAALAEYAGLTMKSPPEKARAESLLVLERALGRLIEEWRNPRTVSESTIEFRFWSSVALRSAKHAGVVYDTSIDELVLASLKEAANSDDDAESAASRAFAAECIEMFLMAREKSPESAISSDLAVPHPNEVRSARSIYFATLARHQRKLSSHDAWVSLALENALIEQRRDGAEAGSFGGDHPVTTTALITLALEIRLREFAAPR